MVGRIIATFAGGMTGAVALSVFVALALATLWENGVVLAGRGDSAAVGTVVFLFGGIGGSLIGWWAADPRRRAAKSVNKRTKG